MSRIFQERLVRQVLLAPPTGKLTRSRSRARWQNISDLACCRPGVKPAELSQIAVDCKVFRSSEGCCLRDLPNSNSVCENKCIGSYKCEIFSISKTGANAAKTSAFSDSVTQVYSNNAPTLEPFEKNYLVGLWIFLTLVCKHHIFKPCLQWYAWVRGFQKCSIFAPIALLTFTKTNSFFRCIFQHSVESRDYNGSLTNNPFEVQWCLLVRRTMLRIYVSKWRKENICSTMHDTVSAFYQLNAMHIRPTAAMDLLTF